jgi:hypothetical protein
VPCVRAVWGFERHIERGHRSYPCASLCGRLGG